MKKFVSLLLVLTLAIMIFTYLPVTAMAGFNPDSPDDDELSAMLGTYYPRAFATARFKDGVVAILEGDEIGYFVNGNAKMIWRHKTDPDLDFLFCINDYYPDAGYELCGFIGNNVVSFRDDLTMRDELDNVYKYGFGEDYLFFFQMDYGSLCIWTPYACELISGNNADEVITTGVYTFYTDALGGHVLGASLADICKKTSEFFNYHPIPSVDLEGNIWRYYTELKQSVENGDVDKTNLFNQEHGIDFSGWGMARHDITLDDFVYYVNVRFSVIEAILDVPFSFFYNPKIYPDIDFYGFDGYIEIERATDEQVQKITWFSHEGSVDMATEICEMITENGGKYVRTDILQTDGAEFVYEYNSRLIHVGHTGANPSTYVYVLADEKGSETASGWVNEDGVWHYYQDGKMTTNEWIHDSGNWYFFDPSGAMAIGWRRIEWVWYYFDASGVMATGWQQIEGEWYYFDPSGPMATGWQNDGGAWYYFGASGAMVTGWQNAGGTWYYFRPSGEMATGWVSDGGVWYYMEPSGTMAIGWKQIGGSWYYFNAGGDMATGWKNIGGVWYYFRNSGAMATGWFEDKEAEAAINWSKTLWYWFDDNGLMATGWKEIDGQWEFFADSGEWLYTWQGN